MTYQINTNNQKLLFMKKLNFSKPAKLWLLICLFSNSFNLKAQDKWQSYYEDESVKIEYQIQECTDAKNDYNFQYYFLKIENKKSSSLNLQYAFNEQLNNEDAFSFILKPKEIQVGSCNTVLNHLRMPSSKR